MKGNKKQSKKLVIVFFYKLLAQANPRQPRKVAPSQKKIE